GVLVAHGVTSVRDMGGDVVRLRDWRAAIATGQLVGPRIRFCGPMLEGNRDALVPGRADHWVVADPAAADATVDRLAGLGVDCIKIRSIADAPTYRALAAAARRHHLPLVGHSPAGVDPLAASAAGQASFEHGFYPWPWTTLSTVAQHRIADAFRRSGSLVTPTLVAWQPFLAPYPTIQAVLDDTRGTTDPRERTVSAALRRNWISGFADRKKWRGSGPASHAAWVKALDDDYRELRDLHDRGVGLLVGTDTGTTMVYPGAAVHQEMKLFVTRLGLRPIDAIIGATILPAKHFGLEADLGTIEAGKLADLVVLSADPLADIKNIEAIDSVILDGRLFDHAALQRLVGDAERRIARGDPRR
ncbi:MAG TPA: amidohydrolase family protein, partial [Kofleriaceae bacterium]|nr:amidohydrolase family protein [Kofleriaceae bacterium]